MSFQKAIAVFGLSSFLLAGCGDHDVRSAIERAELIQDVRLITYSLRSAEWFVDVGYEEGSTESLQKRSQFRDSQSKDRIQRVLDEGRFLLVANDQRLSVALNPQGRFKDVRDFSQNFADGCRVEGGAVLEGEATHLEVRMVWNWNARLVGEGCPQSAQSQFGEFVEAELKRLNLKSATDLLTGLDQAVESSQSISMRLKLFGEINLDEIKTTQP